MRSRPTATKLGSRKVAASAAIRPEARHEDVALSVVLPFAEVPNGAVYLGEDLAAGNEDVGKRRSAQRGSAGRQGAECGSRTG